MKKAYREILHVGRKAYREVLHVWGGIKGCAECVEKVLSTLVQYSMTCTWTRH